MPVFAAIGILRQGTAAHLELCHISKAVIGEVVALNRTPCGSAQGPQHPIGVLIRDRPQRTARLGEAGRGGFARCVIICGNRQPLRVYHAGGQTVHFVCSAGIIVGGGVLPSLLNGAQLVVTVGIGVRGDDLIRTALGENGGSEGVATGIVGHGLCYHDAANYNLALAESRGASRYDDLPNADFVIASLELPAIGQTLPVYPGTGTYALQHGVGLLPESSLPIGGTGTHAIFVGCSGLLHAELLQIWTSSGRGISLHPYSGQDVGLSGGHVSSHSSGGYFLPHYTGCRSDHLSELYELDTKIECHLNHISVNYSFNCCGGMRDINRVFGRADPFSFFKDIYGWDITVSLDFYTHAVVRNDRAVAP